MTLQPRRAAAMAAIMAARPTTDYCQVIANLIFLDWLEDIKIKREKNIGVLW